MADQPPAPGTLFLGTTYHICPALPPSIQEGLDSILSKNGGIRATGVDDPKLNVVITRSEKFDGWEVVERRNRERRTGKQNFGEGEEEEEIHVVTPIWADRSVMLEKKQFPHHFSVSPSMIFSGVSACACSATIPAQDLETLAAGITALGGQWRAHLTSEITHLFVLNPSLNLDPRTGMLPEEKIEDNPNANANETGAGFNANATEKDDKEKEKEKEREREKEKERQLAILLDISPKYSTAMHYQEKTGIKVVLPHWFDDCVKMGKRVDEKPYEWPDVRVLRGVDGVDPITGDHVPDVHTKENSKDKERKEREAKEREREKEREAMGEEEKEREAIKRNVYATAAMFTPALDDVGIPSEADLTLVNETVVLNGLATTTTAAAGKKEKENQTLLSALAPIVTGDGEEHHQVWAGRRILLSRTLKLYGSRRDAVQAQIERAGGVVVRYDGDAFDPGTPPAIEGGNAGQGKWKPSEEGVYEVLSKDEKERRKREAEAVKDCDVLVTRWRDGRAYVEAVQTRKTIGTLAWFFHVQSTGLFARSFDQLLHYPTPKRPIDGFDAHVVTVTNYTGEAREYIKKLINAMGGKFTPSMSSENTALVAAYISGTKANKALSWQIPVVNHTWLEDCFAQWRNLTPARPKYITFPNGVDFARMLGERGVHNGLGPNTISGTRIGVGLVGNTKFVNGVEVEGQVESEQEVLGKIEREAEELGELLDIEEEEEAEMEAEAEARAEEMQRERREGERDGPNGTEESMRRVSAELELELGEREGEEFEFDPPAGGIGDEVDWTMGGLHGDDDDHEDDGEGMMRTSTPKKVGRNAKKPSQTQTPKKTQTQTKKPVKSSSVVPGTSSPAKVSVSMGGVIEIEDSSDEEEEKQERAQKEILSQSTATPQKKKRNLAEVVLTASSSKKNVKAKANSKSKRSKDTDNDHEENSQDDADVRVRNVSKTKTTTIPPSSPLSEMDSPSPVPSPSQQKKVRRKLVRRLVGSSSVSVVGGGEDDGDADVDVNAKEGEKEKEKEGEKKTATRRVLTKRFTGSALDNKEVKDADEEADEDEDDDRPRKKAKTTDAPAPAPAPAPNTKSTSTSALLNKIAMKKGDARTRIKKRNPNAAVKKKSFEESEDEEKDEKEEKEEGSEHEVVVVVSKAKGRGKKVDEKEKKASGSKETAKAKTKAGGKKKKAETSDDDEEEEEEPTKPSKSKSSAKDKSDPKSTKSKKSGKPLRVYSDNSDSESSSAANKSESDDDDDDFDDLPSDPLMPTKSELRAMEKAKKAKEKKGKAKDDVKEEGAVMAGTGKGKAIAKVAQEDDDEEEEEESPKPTTKTKTKKPTVEIKSTSKSKSKSAAAPSKTTTKKRARTPTPSPSPVHSGTESGSNSDSGPPAPRTKKAPTTVSSKKGAKATNTTNAAIASSSSKPKPKNTNAIPNPDATKETPTTKKPLKRVLSVLMPSLSLSPKKAGMKGKSVKAKEKEKVDTDDEDEDGEEQEEEATEVEDEEEEVVQSKSKSKSKPKTAAPPVVPSKSKTTKTKSAKAKEPTPATDEDDEEENEEEEEEEVSAIIATPTPTSPRAKRALAREESIRAVSGHVKGAGTSSTAAAGAAATSTSTRTTKNATSVSARVGSGSGSKTKSAMGPPAVPPTTAPPHSQSQSQSTSSRITSSRTAAANATRKLHESIMPDVLQYEAQVAKARYKSKSKAGRSGGSAAFVVEGDSFYGDEGDGSVSAKGKRKDVEGGDGREVKKRKFEREEEEEDGEEEEEQTTKAKSKAKVDAANGKGAAKKKGKSKDVDGEDDRMNVDEEVDEGGGAGAAKSKSRVVLPGDGIVIMTTQVTLSDDIVKVLTAKLGMKLTTRPNECTHLLAPHVVRTEKFLCALASRAPYVVTKEWGVECAKQGKVLPEADYPLPDARPADNKYQVDLARSIKRAREVLDAGRSGGNKDKNKEATRKLLEGHTFYVTPRVPVDTKLLKNVVVACGGQVSSQTPTHRIISASPTTRHVISCPEDISIWRPIRASGAKIYTQELVLTGVLRMEVGWDDEGFMVKD